MIHSSGLGKMLLIWTRFKSLLKCCNSRTVSPILGNVVTTTLVCFVLEIIFQMVKHLKYLVKTKHCSELNSDECEHILQKLFSAHSEASLQSFKHLIGPHYCRLQSMGLLISRLAHQSLTFSCVSTFPLVSTSLNYFSCGNSSEQIQYR